MNTTDKTDAELEARVQSLLAEIAEVEAEMNRRDEMNDDERLAEYLHSKSCHWDHTEGCSWHYETNSSKVDWTGYAHSRYLEKARRALGKYDFDTIQGVLEILED